MLLTYVFIEMCNTFKYFSYFAEFLRGRPCFRWSHLLGSIKFAFIILDGGIDLGQINKN